jgi:ABC-type Co2+ transport system permease subunit
MSIAVILAAAALTRNASGLRIVYISVAAGMALWGAEQIVYAVTHLAAGESFSADRFGPQWLQAIMLVLAHATLLGVPSGLVAGLILYLARSRRRQQAFDAS